jgi:hypothetical protein
LSRGFCPANADGWPQSSNKTRNIDREIGKQRMHMACSQTELYQLE